MAKVTGGNPVIDDEKNVDQGTAPETAGLDEQVDEGGAKGIMPDEAELDRIAGKRSEHASRAALKSYFQQQGMSPEEAEEAFASYKTAKAEKEMAERNDLAAMQGKFDQMQAQQEKIMALSNKRLINAEALVKASQMQIRPDRVKQAIRLADLTAVTVDENGQVDEAAVMNALEQVTKEMPELLMQAEKESSPGFKIGGPGQAQGANVSDKLAEIFGNKEKYKGD